MELLHLLSFSEANFYQFLRYDPQLEKNFNSKIILSKFTIGRESVPNEVRGMELLHLLSFSEANFYQSLRYDP